MLLTERVNAVSVLPSLENPRLAGVPASLGGAVASWAGAVASSGGAVASLSAAVASPGGVEHLRHSAAAAVAAAYNGVCDGVCGKNF